MNKIRLLFLPITVIVVFLSISVPVNTYAACLNPASAEFDETLNQYWEIVDANQTGLDIVGDMTISMWVKLESGDEKELLSKWNHVSQTSYLLTTTGTNLQLYLNASPSGFGYQSAVAAHGKDLGEWFHLAVVYDSTTGSAEFYVDGKSIGGNAGLPTSISNTSAPFRIGAYATPNAYFEGGVDDVRVWSRTLAGSEISNLYINPIDFDNGANLEAYWKFDNNGNDSSLNGNNLIGVNSIGFSSDVAFGACVDREGLYTQIESPYPSLSETASWAAEDYAGGLFYDCGSTIGECGCAIASLVMMGRSVGIETDILGDDVNPSNINDYLEDINGYTSDGLVKWLAAQAYLSEIQNGQLASKLRWESSYPFGDGDTLDNRLSDGEHAVLGFKNGHFVWLAQKTADSYEVFDPNWYETQTSNEQVKTPTVQTYNNTFESIRVFDVLAESQVSNERDIEVYLKGTAELLFTKVSGEKVGYENGLVVVGLNNSSYGLENIISLTGSIPSDLKHLFVTDAGDDFTLEVIGTDDGYFVLEFFTIDQFGEIQTYDLEGETQIGQITRFSINFETGEVSTEVIEPETINLVTAVTKAVANEKRSTQRLLIAQAENVTRSIEHNRIFVALVQLQVLEFSLNRLDIQDEDLDLVIQGLRDELRS